MIPIISYCALIYMAGWALLATCWGKIFKPMPLGYKLGYSWLAGNALYAAIFFYLAYMNIFTPENTTKIILLLSLLTGFITGWNIVFPLRIKKQLLQILPLLIIVAFFWHLIQHSLTAYLIDWDATGIWFIKAKALFLSNGLHNQYFLQSGHYDFSNRAYPIGIPLVMTGFFKLLHFFDDQAIQFYFVQFFLLLPLMVYSYIKENFTLSFITRIILSIGLFITPLFLNFAHSGYVDLPLSFVFMSMIVGFTLLSSSKSIQEDVSFVSLIALCGFFAMQIKNEGTTFTIMALLISFAYFFFRKKRTITKAIISEVAKVLIPIIFLIIPVFLWRQFVANEHIVFYLTGAHILSDSFSRVKTSIYYYLEVFLNVQVHSLTTIPVLFLASYQIPRLMQRKKLMYLLPTLLIFGQLCTYTFIYAITTMPFIVQLQSSFPRLLLHILPSLYIAVLFQQKGLEDHTES